MPDSEFELDRTYMVPLTRAWIAPRYKRTARAMNVLREFAEKHMKSEEIKINSDLNERIWIRGITKPPRRIKVRMTKDEDGLVTISLPKEEDIEETDQESTENSAEKVSPEEKKETPAKDNKKETASDGNETKARPKKRRSK